MIRRMILTLVLPVAVSALTPRNTAVVVDSAQEHTVVMQLIQAMQDKKVVRPVVVVNVGKKENTK